MVGYSLNIGKKIAEQSIVAIDKLFETLNVSIIISLIKQTDTV